MFSTLKKVRIILTFKAIQRNKNLTLYTIGKIYNIYYIIFLQQYNSKFIQRDISTNLHNFINLKEKTIIQYIIKLCMRIFYPQLYYIENIAN